MPQCTRCRTIKPPEAFSWRNKAKGRRNSACMECARALYKSAYRANPKAYRDRNASQVAAIRALVIAAKDRPCSDCGHKFHWFAMDLDHRNGADKSFSLSEAHRLGYALSVVALEIQKCDVVCAVCHRIRTYQRRTLSSVA